MLPKFGKRLMYQKTRMKNRLEMKVSMLIARHAVAIRNLGSPAASTFVQYAYPLSLRSSTAAIIMRSEFKRCYGSFGPATLPGC